MADKNSAFRGHGYAVRFFLAVLALLSGFALSVSGKTTIDFDPKIDFSKFKTFAYVGGVENLVAIQLNPDLINLRFHHMVVRELEKKGSGAGDEMAAEEWREGHQPGNANPNQKDVRQNLL